MIADLKKIFIASLAILCTLQAVAQNSTPSNTQTLEGLVYDTWNKRPLVEAVVTVSGDTRVYKTDKEGKFSILLEKLNGEITIWYPGFYEKVLPIAGRKFIQANLISEQKPGYATNNLLPLRGASSNEYKQTDLYTLQKSNFSLNKSTLSDLFQSIPGLQVIGKSGMPGEGNFISIRGNNTLTANSTPLIIVNGIPYMPDMNESGIIGGFSKDFLQTLNARDIENITVLKGSEATLYGSLGSNGVILIETEKAVDLDTKVEFISQFGVDQNQARMPVLGVEDYKNYIGSVALTKYSDMNEVLTRFPYLVDNPSYQYNYLYNNNTNWQDEIYRTGFTTDNILKVKGGDAIAKYDLSVGVKNRQGQMDGTNFSKYHARLNSDVILSKKASMYSSISMAYMDYNLQEQGMISETNPLLAALKKGPLFSAYKKDKDNNILPDYAVIRDLSGNLIENNMVSNPLALVNTLTAKEHYYDVQISAGLNYRFSDNLKLRAMGGLYYYMSREDAFVPGITQLSIMPQYYMVAKNTSRSAQGLTSNYYLNVDLSYNKTFNGIHRFSANGGSQVILNSMEYDAGSGYNTANDFYKTLNNVSSGSLRFSGYLNKWNWLNYYGNVNYSFNNQLFIGAKMALDGASSVGPDAQRYQLYPGVNVGWQVKNTLLKNTNWVNKFIVRADYASTGNSQYATSLSKYYYINKVFRELSGLVRAGIPNTKITPELNQTLSIGTDISLFGNRVDFTLDAYQTKNSHLIIPVSVSSAFGTNYLYNNSASSTSKGFDLGVQVGLIQTKFLKWYVGATVSRNITEVNTLSEGVNQLKLEMSDGSAVVSEVGKPIYSFFGYQTLGVFSTAAEAASANLHTPAGTLFQAGDVKFVDQNHDGIIDENDRVTLGSASPDYFGSINTTLRISKFEVSADFNYSIGNKMYNALRRNMESMSDFTNQLNSVNNRWTTEGQVTAIPRAMYGDPMGNSRFSDRFIEDASFLKLKEVMMSYKFNFLSGTTLFVAAENLFVATNYLGLDPETMYSNDPSLRGFDYAKVAHPRSFKAGFKIQF